MSSFIDDSSSIDRLLIAPSLLVTVIAINTKNSPYEDIVEYCNSNRIDNCYSKSSTNNDSYLCISYTYDASKIVKYFDGLTFIRFEPMYYIQKTQENVIEIYDTLDKDCYVFCNINESLIHNNNLLAMFDYYEILTTTFNYSWYMYPNRGHSFCIHLPDYNSYKKLCLLLGGDVKLELDRYSRQERLS